MAKKSIKAFSGLLIALLLFSCALSGSGHLSASESLSCFSPINACHADTLRTPSPTFSATTSANVGRTRTANQSLRVYPGGMPFGVKFITEGVLVVGFCDIQNGGQVSNPSLDAGLRQGDLILKINGNPLSGAAELTDLVEKGNGAAIQVLYSRDGKEYRTTLTPVYSGAEGRYKTGIYVRDSGAGIGTVTFILPESYAFGGLGHGICDAETGALLPIQRGSVVGVTISGVVKGLSGTPGEVKGYFSSGKTGSLLSNTDCGVYGVLSSLPAGTPSDPIDTAKREELKSGKAHIYCTLDSNKTECYEIEIFDIHRDATSNKCFSIRVTDPRLLDKTGGIIQGMSGSPIIQNGKLVGAVTHVLINDPTTGYGIFIDNMLNQMGDLAA